MEFLETIAPAIEVISIVVDLIGVALILIGAVKFTLRAAVVEFERLRGIACVYRIRHNRVELGGYILAALEFMIVSDILHTVITREIEDLYFLGLLAGFDDQSAGHLGRALTLASGRRLYFQALDKNRGRTHQQSPDEAGA